MQIASRNYLYRTIRRVFLLARIMLLPVAPTPILFVPTRVLQADYYRTSQVPSPGGQEAGNFFSPLLSINTCVFRVSLLRVLFAHSSCVFKLVSRTKRDDTRLLNFCLWLETEDGRKAVLSKLFARGKWGRIEWNCRGRNF